MRRRRPGEGSEWALLSPHSPLTSTSPLPTRNPAAFISEVAGAPGACRNIVPFQAKVDHFLIADLGPSQIPSV